jgi:hypothetical protein
VRGQYRAEGQLPGVDLPRPVPVDFQHMNAAKADVLCAAKADVLCAARADVLSEDQ